MWQAEDALVMTARRVVVLQLVITLLAAIAAFFFKGLAFSLALIYGGGIVLVGTWVQAWRLKAATEDEARQPVLKPGVFMQSILLRLLVMLAMLVLGMHHLRLLPLALLTGLVLAYSGYFFARAYAPRATGR
ncbi:MAG: ATP synthase subunit I [Gammaproteobacteria bacterium]|nr:ATP synthase subunit I [Gammaproteobacteria bacterium]